MLNNGKATGLFSLIASFSTLICCALPALMVALGAGATLAGLVSAFPQLAWFGLYKNELFSFSAIMLVIAGIAQYRARTLPCPADPALALQCAKTRRVSFYIYLASLIVFSAGVFFAYFAVYVFY